MSFFVNVAQIVKYSPPGPMTFSSSGRLRLPIVYITAPQNLSLGDIKLKLKGDNFMNSFQSMAASMTFNSKVISQSELFSRESDVLFSLDGNLVSDEDLKVPIVTLLCNPSSVA
jgi:hypothetical protein